MSGAPKQEPLSPEAVAFQKALAEILCRHLPPRLGDFRVDIGVPIDVAARLFDAHRVNAHASLVAQIQRKDEALKALLKYAERNECHHEETHRAGFIWTICDSCGGQWADDRGGFQPYEEPAEFEAARAALSEKGESRD